MAARRQEKKLARQANNQSDKRINAMAEPSRKGKLPVVAPRSIDEDRFAWSAQAVDYDYKAEWDWDLSPRELFNVLSLLSGLSNLTWREVKAQTYNGRGQARRVLHKSQPVDSICAEAQARLESLSIQTESVFRLRHGSDIRVWGYLEGALFHIVWYDRAHAVCPVD
ncbi:hypothetical protein [Rhodococcus sp. JG-3]|uniref:hypothetical protein n=1 Tax=Rhodococcus sp. JG-3 TaxID=1305835 RepID=UPI0006857B2E|nr:hypothetical protein [Rhodococcus sp. JG-3]